MLIESGEESIASLKQTRLGCARSLAMVALLGSAGAAQPLATAVDPQSCPVAS